MPYTMENPPEYLKNLPDDLVKQWIDVFNSYHGENPDESEETARAFAWTAVKKKWRKNDEGKWMKVQNFGELIDDVEILKAGKFVALSGEEVEISGEDLDRIVNGYDPAYSEAPVVVGHPANNEPAYGWVKALKRVKDKVVATLDVIPEFGEAIRKSLFKKRSSSIYKDLDGKGLYLRHVGFLGAVPPAIKGLADIKLNDGGDVLHLEFQEEGKRMSWKDLFKKAVDEMPDEGTGNPPVQRTVPPVRSFSEAEVNDRVKAAEEQARKEAREQALAEFSEREATRIKGERKKTIKARVDALVEKGKVIPAWVKAGLVEFVEALGWSDEEKVEFAEGKKDTPQEWFFNFLESLPKAVEFEEFAGKDKELPPGSGAGDKLSTLISKKMVDEKKDYHVAFSEVQAEYPELAAQYLSEVRPQ